MSSDRDARSCLSDDDVTELVEGRMSAEETSRVDRHMADCAACRSWVADAAKLAFGRASSPPTSSPEPRPGDLVGRYRLLHVVGAGGMGVVYAGEDPELGRTIALKLIRTELSTTLGEELQRRLQYEARAMAKISHPNVVAIHDIGTLGGHVFIAMEYVQGTTLREWTSAKRRGWEEILEAFIAAGQGLAAAHAAGLVHRDFKPENVLRGEDGRVRVTDFGLAHGDLQTKADDARGGKAPGSPRERLAGTPAYMAPEQLLGSPADARSDQFSFCVALFEALYGSRPFPAKEIRELVSEIARGAIAAPPPDSEAPPEIHGILTRGLSWKAEDRYESMRALLDELTALSVRSRDTAAPSSLVPTTVDEPASGRRRKLGVVALLSTVALAIIAGSAVLFAKRPAHARPPGDGECPRGPGLYCSGHGVEGAEATLYRCGEQGITEERNCNVACLHLFGGASDACDVESTRCPLGNGVYCGGNHISADPNTLYRCRAGVVTVERVCSSRCVKEPDGVKDHCAE